MVLILVLMEDALVQKNRVEDPKNYISLNPCFNGRCTRTFEVLIEIFDHIKVLILVLMEDALVLR